MDRSELPGQLHPVHIPGHNHIHHDHNFHIPHYFYHSLNVNELNQFDDHINNVHFLDPDVNELDIAVKHCHVSISDRNDGVNLCHDEPGVNYQYDVYLHVDPDRFHDDLIICDNNRLYVHDSKLKLSHIQHDDAAKVNYGRFAYLLRIVYTRGDRKLSVDRCWVLSQWLNRDHRFRRGLR